MGTIDYASVARERSAAISDALSRVADPVREQIRELDADLATLDEARASLNETRKEAIRLLRFAAPDDPLVQAVGKPGPKIGTSKNGEVSEALLEKTNALSAYVQRNRRDLRDGFTMTQLRQRPGFPEGIGTSSLSAAFDLLQARGVVRLDRLVKGGGKLWKVNEEEDDV